ncbi:MAG: FecCD family ABC transporter permease [Acidimicrobiales bacterium]
MTLLAPRQLDQAGAPELYGTGRPSPPGVRPTRLRPAHIVIGVAFLLAAATTSVLVGPAGLSPASVLEELASKLPFVHLHPGLGATGAAVVWQIRMPRMVLGALVGAMLAVAGASYQGVFSNPLADPYLLGVASGAGLGATIAIVYGAGLDQLPISPVPAAAFVGALVAVAATFSLGRSKATERSTASLVLAGVAVAAFFTAVQTFIQQRQSPGALSEIYTWILGELSTAGWSQVLLVLPYVAVAAGVLFGARRLLDVLSVGDEEATSVGVRADRVRLVVVAAATLGTAAAVSVSGLIGFVGIIVPHTIRLLAGPSYRRIIPLSLLFGAGFLVLADILARTALSPQELPLGVVTAFLGAPFFLIVLRQSRRGS